MSAFTALEFFDARDVVQVKYEMVRRVRVDGEPVARSAAEFGFSRPSFYEAAAALDARGLTGLVPARPGPRRAHKLTEEVLAFARDHLAGDPALQAGGPGGGDLRALRREGPSPLGRARPRARGAPQRGSESDEQRRQFADDVGPCFFVMSSCVRVPWRERRRSWGLGLALLWRRAQASARGCGHGPRAPEPAPADCAPSGDPPSSGRKGDRRCSRRDGIGMHHQPAQTQEAER